MEKPTVLTRETLIPIGFLTLVFGAAMWLTSMWKQGEVNASQIKEIKVDQERNNDKIYDRLGRIEDKLDRLIEKSRK
jgi:hypothetical protein